MISFIRSVARTGKVLRTLLFSAAALITAAVLPAAAQMHLATAKPLRLAFVNSYGEEIMQLYYGKTLKVIREAIAPRQLEITIYGPDTFLDAAYRHSFDMSIASSGITSVMLNRTGGMRLLTAVNANNPDPYHGNGAAIVVLSGRDDINKLEDLNGKKLAAMSITAFAGWQVPVVELARQGIEARKFFRDIVITGEPMTLILEALKRGEADVGFVVNCLLEDMVAMGKLTPGTFKVINEKKTGNSACRHSTELYANWVLAVKPGVNPATAKAVTQALLDMKPDNRISYSWTVTPDMTGADEVFQNLNLPYSVGYGLRDLLREHSKAVFGLLAALALLIVNFVVLLVAVRVRARQVEEVLHEKMQADLAAQRNALRLQTIEKLSAVGTLSSMAAHELKQPLTVINNYAGSLKRRLVRGEVPRDVLIEALSDMESAGLKAAEVIDLVRGYAANKERQFLPVDLADIVGSICRRFKRESHIFEVSTVVSTFVSGDKTELELVVANLVKNALSAVRNVEKPRVTLSVSRDDTFAYIRVADNGKPISDEAFALIGQIGRTTNKNGMGLGLVIVRSLLEAHGGALKMERGETCGLICTVRLPLETNETTNDKSTKVNDAPKQ